MSNFFFFVSFLTLSVVVSSFQSHVVFSHYDRGVVRTNLSLSSSTNNNNGSNVAHVTFVAGSAASGYGQTSPEPNPTWKTVTDQLAKRLPNFAGTATENDGQDLIATQSIEASSLQSSDLVNGNTDVLVVLGVADSEEERKVLDALEKCSDKASIKAILADPTCSEEILNRRYAGPYKITSTLGNIVSKIAPWTKLASGKRLLDKTQILLERKSSEDYIFAILFVIHALVTDIDVVKSDINPSWEKGPVQNVKEFKKMTDCCGPQIAAALSDPQSKKAIDLLNAVDLRDQVGSYRVIVSNETPQLEDFTLCILQQNNCFNCDSPILTRPKVPLIDSWPKGKALTDEASRQILIGHLDHPDANQKYSQKKPWSWKIVVGANPAYDAFPMQHQIFYPTSSSKSLWYDPVFCVETLEGDLVWCKRHYRCTPRKHWSSSVEAGNVATPGAWTLNTLDNGMVSEEQWTTVDAADDLSWVILHYSGAARRAGQSYLGALLCTADGVWPATAQPGTSEFDRIRDGFRKCDLELWELFGGSTSQSLMWSSKFTDWAETNPPPLDRIGDISITAWRKQEREKSLLLAGSS